MSFIKKFDKTRLIYFISALILVSILNKIFVPEGFFRGFIFGFSTIYMIWAIVLFVKKEKK